MRLHNERWASYAVENRYSRYGRGREGGEEGGNTYPSVKWPNTDPSPTHPYRHYHAARANHHSHYTGLAEVPELGGVAFTVQTTPLKTAPESLGERSGEPFPPHQVQARGLPPPEVQHGPRDDASPGATLHPLAIQLYPALT